MNEDGLVFHRGAVRPMDCLRDGWHLIKEDYWLFLGIAFVGALIAGAGSFILAGPIMCGIDICLLRQMRGRRISFEMLFEGFNYFLQSFIAALAMFVPAMLCIGVLYAAFIISMITILGGLQGGGPRNADAVWLILALEGAFFLGILAVVFTLQAAFLFTFPLIVDRKLSGMEAVTLGFRATLGNLGGVMGLVFLGFLVNLAGALACCFGAYFVLPLVYAMNVVAYRQVFPEPDRHERAALEDEPDEPEPGEPSQGIEPARPRSGISE